MRTTESFYSRNKYWSTPFDSVLLYLIFVMLIPFYIYEATKGLARKGNVYENTPKGN